MSSKFNFYPLNILAYVKEQILRRSVLNVKYKGQAINVPHSESGIVPRSSLLGAG
jgi:hypothetical protein